MRIVLLGTTGYHPNDRRHTPCMILPECGVILDAGTAMYRIGRYLETSTIDIFLTHAHIDHVIGLTYLLDVVHDFPLEKIRVHALPEHLAALDEHLFSSVLFPKKPAYESCPFRDGVDLAGGGRLTFFPLKHVGPSLGFRLDWPDRSMAYVTDTTADLESDYVNRIAGVDLLLHECYFGDDNADWAKKTGHSSTSQVAAVAKKANVGRLVLVHINPRSTDDDPVGLEVAREIFPNTEIGEDLMELEF